MRIASSEPLYPEPVDLRFEVPFFPAMACSIGNAIVGAGSLRL
jgi:hypothetical protein